MGIQRPLSYESFSVAQIILLLLCIGGSLPQTPYGYAEPIPLAAPLSNKWLGYDGNWSPVTIRVGTPPQWVYVFPSTLSSETWVIAHTGCDGTFTCEDKRGGLFASNGSSTWDNIGFYELGFDLNLGVTGVADYGFDDIALSEHLSVPSQIIAVQNSTEFWTGLLGLGIKASNFTNADQPSFLSSLVENASAIPSHSYGYTAGAYYQLKGVPASLTFGGVDTQRFIPNSATFTLGPDQEPVVAINEVTVSSMPLTEDTPGTNWKNNPLTLLSAADSALFTIDSSTPFLWLPESVCDRFATALNLTYSEELELYLFANSTSSGNMSPATDQVNALTSLNITFSFTISDLPDKTGSSHSSNTIELVLPFAAFSLDLTYPFPRLSNASASSPSVPYFPLRRAANDTQFTIGRAFLQETYLTVDYERNNFSLSQATFSLDAQANAHLVPITRPPKSNLPGPKSSTSSGLSTGAKAGIGVGVAIAALITLSIVTIFLIRYRNKRRARALSKPTSSSSSEIEKPPSSFLRRLLGSPSTSSRSSQPASELLASERQPSELNGDRQHPIEIPSDRSNERYEMPSTNAVPVEMPAEIVPMNFSQNHSRSTSELPEGQALARSNSTEKNALVDEVNGIRTANLNLNTNTNINIDKSSPNDPTHPPRYSDTNPISPMTPANARAFNPARFNLYNRTANRNSNSNSDGVSPSTPAFAPSNTTETTTSERTTDNTNGTSNPISSPSASASASRPSPAFSSPNARHSSGSGNASPLRLSFSPPRRDESGSLRVPSATQQQQNGGGLQRDGSRSSRFREEGIIGDVSEDLYGQYPLQERKYSWEEE